MIFGKNKFDKRQSQFDALWELKNAYDKGFECFAYLPVRLYDGRWLWLDNYLFTASSTILPNGTLWSNRPTILWHKPQRYQVSK